MRTNWQRRRSGGDPFESLESRNLLAATPQLLADINTQQSSYPDDFIEFDGRLVYTADHAAYGRELWISDGTAAGTQLLKDIGLGSSSSSVSDLVVVGDWLYFVAQNSASGRELWRSDGTTAGTSIVRDIRPGGSSALSSNAELEAVGNTLFFIADNGTNGNAVWKSDGTAAGTVMVKDLTTSFSDGLSDFTAVGNTLYFLGNDGTHGVELWKSDGTAEGTVLVKDMQPGSSSPFISQLTSFNGALYFQANAPNYGALWMTDGTAEGTDLVQGLESFQVGSFETLTVAGDQLFFPGSSASRGTELWVVQAAIPGIALPVGDFEPGTGSFLPRAMLAIGDVVYFTATAGNEYGLWKSDGTLAGTQLLRTLVPGEEFYPIRELTAYNGELYFATHGKTFAADLWRSDGTPQGTTLLRSQIAPAGNSEAVRLGVAGGELFFSGDEGNGIELWKTDGSAEGTQLVVDVDGAKTDDSNPTNFVTAGSHVFFTANNGSGVQLYATAGSAGPVIQLTSSANGVQSSRVEQLTVVGELLYFSAVDADGYRYLGVSDGTVAGTHAVDWPLAQQFSAILGVTSFQGGVIFLAARPGAGWSLYRADANGIEIVRSLGEVMSLRSPMESLVWQGNYYFFANNDLFRSDGTAAGTYLLRTVVPNLGSSPRLITATTTALYFVSQNKLWKTDGTVAGTQSFNFAYTSGKLIGAGDRLFFTMPSSGSPAPYGTLSLWVTTGTQASTRKVGDIYDDSFDPGGRSVPIATAIGSTLYFFGPGSQQQNYQVALWKSDGTVGGTSRVTDVVQYWGTYLPDLMTAEGKVYLTAGYDLFESDGTANGTRQLFQAFGLLVSGVPLAQSLTRLGDTLYFHGGATGVGTEPFTFTPAAATVVGRRLFYNQSQFDNSSSALSEMDDHAIASDKTAYLAGSGVATFENISSYSRGINGVMIDFADLPLGPLSAKLTLNDFVFRVGSNSDLSTWTAAPAPTEFSVRFLAGDPSASARVSFRWANNAIQNTWLEVTVLANQRTGLATPDVFYFGNRIGDTGSGTATAATTTAADELLVRNSVAPNQPITSQLDFNRDMLVTATDALIARGNIGVLRKLDLPAVGAAVPLAVTATAADREASHDRGISRSLAQHWLKLASDSLEDSPLEASLLDVLTKSRARRGVRG